MGLPAHGKARDAKPQQRRDLRDLAIPRLAAGQRIRDDPDGVAARRLLPRQVQHMAKKAADRRPEHMEDAQAWFARRHMAFIPQWRSFK